MRDDEHGGLVRFSPDIRNKTFASPAGTPDDPAAMREDHVKSRDELAREVEVLGERIATLSAAVLLLRLHTLNAGRVSTYESLIRRLWNGPGSGDPDRVRTFIKQLRRKLGDGPARPSWIFNERGVGYRVPRPEE